MLINKNDLEFTIIVLRVILAFLEKYEKVKNSIPIEVIRSNDLINKLMDYMNKQEDMAGEISRYALSIMIQISYLSPDEF
jgi:hypothetical protein